MHKFGEYYESPNSKHIYVNTPKCASTSIKSAIAKNGFKKKYGYSDKPGFAIIREPFERYISGVYEYWRQRVKSPDFEEWVSKSEHPKVYDEHTEHQHKFLEGFNVELIPMEKTDYLVRLLAGNVNTPQSNPGSKNEYENLFNRDNIIKFYKKDKVLYEESL